MLLYTVPASEAAGAVFSHTDITTWNI